ncbi:hypothetical protein T07_3464 [Trichinella nelsoni]|uniref:Uncharacterized protein n=1 Tax=Trichinella nelsoni TaxID=6336 RepID=A0A0V0SEY8_9BILA|nr:hypothetical protein T07_3464 [Trichinella nelsoni]
MSGKCDSVFAGYSHLVPFMFPFGPTVHLLVVDLAILLDPVIFFHFIGSNIPFWIMFAPTWSHFRSHSVPLFIYMLHAHVEGVAVISAEHPDLITKANRLPPDEHHRTLAIEHVIQWRYLTHSAAFGEFLVVRKVDILIQSREAVPVQRCADVFSIAYFFVESPAVGRRTLTLNECFELATASRASSIVVSLTALLPSKLSSFTDIEDRVAALVEAVRGSRNGEKAFTFEHRRLRVQWPCAATALTTSRRTPGIRSAAKKWTSTGVGCTAN